MSMIKYCPRGGQDGIYYNDKEMYCFFKILVNAKVLKDSDALDLYVPLPDKTTNQQIEVIQKGCNCKEADAYLGHQSGSIEYFERESGSHGWCCNRCGRVHQWG